MTLGYNSNQSLRLTEIDDIMCPAGNHVDNFNLIATDLKFHRFTCVDIAFLDEFLSGNHDKQLPLAVVPVLTLGNAGVIDIDANLSTILCVDKFGKRITVIHIQLEGILELLGGQIYSLCFISTLVLYPLLP